MQALFAALFAVMIGLTFAGSTFAAEEKKDAAPAGEMKKDEGKKVEKKAKKAKKAEKKEEKK